MLHSRIYDKFHLVFKSFQHCLEILWTDRKWEAKPISVDSATKINAHIIQEKAKQFPKEVIYTPQRLRNINRKSSDVSNKTELHFVRDCVK